MSTVTLERTPEEATRWATQRAELESSQAYMEVYAALINAAQRRTVITYPDIAHIMSLPPSGNMMGVRIGRMLQAIVEREHELGRPILSAIAVSKSNGRPGEGFYWVAQGQGKLSPNATPTEQWAFLAREQDRVYRTWALRA